MGHRVPGPRVRFGVPTMLVTLLSAAGLETAPPVEVRFRGVTHGLLALRSTSGVTVALGDLLQTSQADRVESRMTFHFKEGSLYDEILKDSQQQIFTMVAYRLVQFIVGALEVDGFGECKHAIARSRRAGRPAGGVWQGVNPRTGSTASVVWVSHAAAQDARVFIEIDGQPIS